jgi:hypothetical protein
MYHNTGAENIPPKIPRIPLRNRFTGGRRRFSARFGEVLTTPLYRQQAGGPVNVKRSCNNFNESRRYVDGCLPWFHYLPSPAFIAM